ncbi:MAG: type VI secretion protein IcmF/TssM N-terminal domain-containing protein [Desulfococcaceae bacterium]
MSLKPDIPSAPKMPKAPKVPKAPEVVKSAKIPGGGFKAKSKTLLRVFKPLIYLPLLGIAALLVYYLVPHSLTLGRFTVDPRFLGLVLIGIVSGILVLYVCLRLVNYLLQRRRIKKQETRMGSAELREITEGILSRWEAVEYLHKSAHVGLYDMPWYLIIGESEADTLSLLEGSDLTFPDSGAVEPLNSDPEAVDHWIFSREAVFVDTTFRNRKGIDADTEALEQEALLTVLAEKRRRCPVNGILLVLTAVDLALGSEDLLREKARAYKRQLRRITDLLAVRAPIYLVVTGMERVLGFSDFFGDLDETEREQIFGWSDPGPPGGEFSLNRFSKALTELADILDQQRFVRGSGGGVSPDTANRAAFFPDEFQRLMRPVEDTVKVIFTKSRFEDPLIFRGIYFTGGRDFTTPVSLYGKHFLPSGILESISQADDYPPIRKPLFTRDLFSKKIFAEPGLVRRPPSVKRKNRRIALAALLAFGLLIFVGGAYLWDFSAGTLKTVTALEADLNQAREILETRRADIDTLPLCIRLTDHKKQLQQKGLLTRVVGLGRYEELVKEIGSVHRSVFQQTLLAPLIGRTETRLREWTGNRALGGAGFPRFADALTEYIQWSNPDPLSLSAYEIRPFLDLLQFPQQLKYQYLSEYDAFLQEGGMKGPLVDAASAEIIQKALTTVTGYMQPVVSDMTADSENLTDAQWWLKLAMLLESIRQNYRALLKADIPAAVTPTETMFSEYRAFTTFLKEILSQKDYLLAHLRTGQANRITWLNPETIYSRLGAAAGGMTRLETAVEKDRQVVLHDYRSRVTVPIDRNLPVVNMLTEYPSETWLTDLVSRPLGAEHMGVSYDFGIGGGVLDLLRTLAAFDTLTEGYYTRWDAWRSNLPERITPAAYQTPPLHLPEFRRKSHDIATGLTSLEERAAPAESSRNGAAAGAPPADTETDEALEERKKAVAAFWRVSDLLEGLKSWHTVQNRIKMNGQSLYLREVIQRAEFRQGIPAVTGWREMKSIALFQRADGVALVEPVNRMVTQWLNDIPQPIRAMVEQAGEVAHFAELAHFEEMMKAYKTLQNSYMQAFRESADKFATCVNQMDADPVAAWRVLRESSAVDDPTNQPVSWKNLLSFSDFKKKIEIEAGPIVQPVTRQFVEIESHVFGVYKDALLKSYSTTVDRLADRYAEMNIGEKFPFRVDGDQMDNSLLLGMLDEMNTLQRRFELDEGIYVVTADGRKTPVSSISQKILNEMTRGGQQDFYQDFSAFGAFLFDDRQPKPHKVQASVIPGPVGSHFHWLRLVFGNGDITDLNVYGVPVKEMTVLAGEGSVTIHGLDAARMPQASAVAAKGDLAFFQMVYLFGRPEDPARTTWITEIEIPLSINPAHEVQCPFQFVFDEGLPALPDWRDFARQTQ